MPEPKIRNQDIGNSESTFWKNIQFWGGLQYTIASVGKSSSKYEEDAQRRNHLSLLGPFRSLYIGVAWSWKVTV